MKEKASRFAASAGSEEIELIPDPKDINRNRSDAEDDYSPPRSHRKTLGSEKEQNMSFDDSYQLNSDEKSRLNNGNQAGNGNSILHECFTT